MPAFWRFPVGVRVYPGSRNAHLFHGWLVHVRYLIWCIEWHFRWEGAIIHVGCIHFGFCRQRIFHTRRVQQTEPIVTQFESRALPYYFMDAYIRSLFVRCLDQHQTVWSSLWWSVKWLIRLHANFLDPSWRKNVTRGSIGRQNIMKNVFSPT